MKELGKWQMISFVSRGIAMFLGLVQSFVIVRILSVSEWGVIQLAVSIGGALGIYQHLGLASASTREISSAKDETDIFKIFLTSAFIRYFVTIPIAIGLFFFSDYISIHLYRNSLLILPLKFYAIALLFQAVQSILNSVVAGTRRFKQLFIYQALIALVSVSLFVPLVYYFRINGYFYAFVIFNIICAVVLSVLSFRPLKGKILLPSRKDFRRLIKELFSISMAIYLVKIIYTNWEKMGPNILGLSNTAEIIGIFSFSLLFAKKLMAISDAVTDVNLPVFSEKYVNDFKSFTALFSKNFDKIFTLIVLVAAVAIFWSPEFVRFVVGGAKYDRSLPLIPPMVLAFVLYSFVNIVHASVLIPSKLSKDMVFSYALLILGSIVFFFSSFKILGGTIAMAWGMSFGAMISYIYMILIVQKRLLFKFFTRDHWLVLIQSFFVGWAGLVDVLWVKVVIFFPFVALLVWSFFISKLLTKEEVRYASQKFFSLAKRYAKR